MKLSRRGFLKLASVAAGGIALSSCSRVYEQLASFNKEEIALSSITFSAETVKNLQILNRLSYGTRLLDLQFVQKFGINAWIEEQLSPELLTDLECNIRLRSFDTLSLDADTLRDISDKLFDGVDEESVPNELRKATVIRQVYSKRQLYESLVEFWTDHFNISVDKGACWYLKTVDDREVIRKYSMGNFYDLLRASAHSPAMLIYLDNQSNKKGKPNENYARELLELHTLGIQGGYSQKDVMELARCLTGWSVKDHFWNGQFTFRKDEHDHGEKIFLKKRIRPAGEKEMEQVIKIIAHHKSTAGFVSNKLIRRFITEEPAPELAEIGRKVFLQTKGDIRQVLRAILFNGINYMTPKFKRPNRFIISALRILDANTDGGDHILDYLQQMGQDYFSWPTPDGFPDASDIWRANLIPRWQFALALVENKIKGTSINLEELLMHVGTTSSEEVVERLNILLIGKQLSKTEIRSLIAYHRNIIHNDSDLLKIFLMGILISPEFQWY